MPYEILIIDDEADIRDLVADALRDENYKVRSAPESMSAFNLINEYVPDVLILDIWLQGSDLDGLGILEIVRKKYPNLKVIIISGHGTIETAVSAIKMGAYDYIEKPFTEDKLIITVKRAIEAAKLFEENIELKTNSHYNTELIGNSNPIIQLKSLIDKYAPTSSRILITGALGTGKDFIAKYIHKKSKRSKEVFKVFNCHNISCEKAIIDLFGDKYIAGIHEKTRKIGLLERTNGGTLFINEVGDLPLMVQNKLLKFLQNQEFQRPGTENFMKLDIRLICSTTRDLQQDINENKFNKDLFSRLNIVPLKLPNLSELKEDIAELANHFIKLFVESSNLVSKTISVEALSALNNYNWPGNIKQLRHVIEGLLIANDESDENESSIINIDLLPLEILSGRNNIVKLKQNFDIMSLSLKKAREIFEKQYLTDQMNRFNGNISKTSNFVGMERSALHRKLKSLNIHSNNVQNEEENLLETI